MSKEVKDILFDAFLKSGNIGYHILYSRLLEEEDEDERT